MALPLSAEQMITIGEAYYSDIREEMSIPRTQEIVAGPLVVPQDGEPRGVAVQRGLKELLNSPNIYPVGDNSRQVRMCVQLFDNSLARVNDRDNDWRTQIVAKQASLGNEENAHACLALILWPSLWNVE